MNRDREGYTLRNSEIRKSLEHSMCFFISAALKCGAISTYGNLYPRRKIRYIHFQHSAFKKIGFVFKNKIAQRHSRVVQHA
ncbi:hypothetical protein SAMN05660293_00680 [Dyadobacter psychrophilus]|uniref:Uncharacterized protein n=1 Tax=Dyadobacter psychrophilus TaxID=651661 RepID=A0A1T5BX89_9BACT|nr:hypothetical protein SAMN05660293_00680 [Dyadobacter psychrophilus]